MKKKTLLIILGIIFSKLSFSQENSGDLSSPPNLKPDSSNCYIVKAKLEIPLVAVLIAFDTYNFSQISSKEATSEATVLGLKNTDVNSFDRWGIRPYSEKMDNASYIPFYVAMPLPVIVFALDKRMRKDFFKLTFLYAEAMVITGALYSSAVAYADRLRPMVYSPETPIGKRTAASSRNSFFAGHVALVGTSTFFVARVIADYHPESKYKWLYYSIAGVTTVATGYMRQAAGEHFLSDILIGTTVGTLSGLLTPALHKNKAFKDQRLSFIPFGGNSNGITALYRF